MNPVVPAIGLLAATVGITVTAPQVLRLVRTPNADGMSHGSAVLGLLATTTWLTYGVMITDAPQILANVPGIVGAVAIYVLVVTRGGFAWRPGLAGALTWAALITAAFVLRGPQTVGMLATAVTLVARVPQVHTVFRSTSLAALSRTSMLLGAASASLWLSYGILTADMPVWTSSSAVLVLTAVILGRQAYVLRAQRQPARATDVQHDRAHAATGRPSGRTPAQVALQAQAAAMAFSHGPLTPSTVPLPRISVEQLAATGLTD